jgi:hypothetical protein
MREYHANCVPSTFFRTQPERYAQRLVDTERDRAPGGQQVLDRPGVDDRLMHDVGGVVPGEELEAPAQKRREGERRRDDQEAQGAAASHRGRRLSTQRALHPASMRLARAGLLGVA